MQVYEDFMKLMNFRTSLDTKLTNKQHETDLGTAPVPYSLDLIVIG